MTDSMKFGPEWLRSLSSDNSTMGVSSGGGGIRCQLAEYRYGREEMLALFEKGLPPPSSLCTFSSLYSEQSLPPLALVPATDEDRQWLARGPPMGTSVRGRGGSAGPADRGGRGARGGRGSYPSYGRSVGYESSGGGGWGNGEQSDWSPRKDFSYGGRTSSSAMDNWRRSGRIEDEDGWRSGGRGSEKTVEKWSRSNSWREGDDDRGTQDKMGRSWHDGQRGGGGQQRRMWDDHDHLPEWATENLSEGGGTFDASGAFHGSDDEQDGKGKREQHHLQKSASQHTITTRTSHAPLSSSKSALSLSKPSEPPLPDHQEESKDAVLNHTNELEKKGEAQKPPPLLSEPKQQQKPVPVGLHEESNSVPPKQNSSPEESGNGGSRVVDEDFDKLQEDVLKLVVDEEPTNTVPPHVPHSNGVQPPPPNMMPPLQEKWFYQDPQGDLQGPFCSSEMAEWFRAGYFSTTLYVRRQCDQTFYTLGELVTLCGGNNPFQTSAPIVPLKENKLVVDDVLQYHQLMQAHLALRTPRPYGQGEPWNTLGSMQQREMMAQQLLAQSQIPPEPFLQQTNPGLIHMFNQLNQVKMPVQPQVVDKPPNTIPCQLDPLQALVQQMGGLQQMQNRLPTAGAGPNLAQTLGAPAGLKHEPSLSALHGLPMNGMPGGTVPVLPAGNLIGGGMQNPAGLGKMDGDGNMNFLQMFKKQQHQMEQNIDLEALWKRSQFTGQSNQTPPPPQWQQSDKPISMWDVPTPPSTNVETTPPDVHQMNKENANLTKQKQANDAAAAAAKEAATKEAALKEEKKKKEAEEKQAKKEAEEKRRQEQKRLEAEKKQQEEKKRKEEERVKRELEKAKKESEEKRLRELAEKRRLKEQRKAEEEARRKAEELRKQEELEREKLAAKEREEHRKRQAEFARQSASEAAGNGQKPSRAAPWSQSTSNQGLSLAEIQKLERERKAEQALVQQQQRLQQSVEQANAAAAIANAADKNNGLQLNWANKPVKHGQVKSLAEIQAEEQERLLKIKQANEKVMQQQKEKESLSPPTSRIWQANTLSWNQPETNAGFWDEPPKQSSNRANSEPKMRQNANTVNSQQAVKQAPNKPKAKSKKDEHSLNNNNNTNVDEFADWCTKTLANMNTSVDVPTFITFLRDIESALDVRDYCREYLGDKPATQQFAAQFLEKRRLYKPKATAPKDDMCVPAPAITPSTQHNNDFQEVKGKGKKCKKSKMFKVDSRCLGFSVTASHDRINVGDRDYGDTT